jgi:hypothetical protein
MSQQASPAGQIHVEGLTPEVLDDLLREYPAIRPFCTPSPSNTSVAEQPEKSLLDIVITLAPPTLTMIGAVLNFLAAHMSRATNKSRATKMTLSQADPSLQLGERHAVPQGRAERQDHLQQAGRHFAGDEAAWQGQASESCGLAQLR